MAMERLFAALDVGGWTLRNRVTVAPMTLQRGEADFVSLGRGALTHSDWPRRVREGASVEDFDRGLLSPVADLESADRYRAERPSVRTTRSPRAS
ncbi:hypothetical protein SAMN05444354_101836 [Stigmatella aurantiaca]|uniref:Uncharacterized protein n=1 Tax=Stigmatella aurantiaca TaxID=41 RepID=A0A1H7HVI4_STIAU|nr:hypothetical protein SAMN05444354_101836 [Stigmatella aurantiaca]